MSVYAELREALERAPLINTVGIAARFGVSKSTAHAWTHQETFPAPVRYEGGAGLVNVWFVGEVEAWRRRRPAGVNRYGL